MQLKCASTKKPITNDIGTTIFPCPQCGETLVRGKQARVIGARYTCHACGFTGPN